MPWPLIIQYVDSITKPLGLFKTLANVEYQKDIFDNPLMCAGGNAVVFKVKIGNQLKALKCYTKPKANIHAIDLYLKNNPDDLIIGNELLKEELFVYFGSNGHYFDVQISDWCEGRFLDFEIKRCVFNHHFDLLERYSEEFNLFAIQILEREWAHGDIKPENIYVNPAGGFKLIDTDAMYIPTLSESDEIGTPNYRHPNRSAKDFGPHIDDYPLLLIAVSLRAIALDITLFDKYTTKDNIILNPHEILAGNSACYNELVELFAKRGEWRYMQMLRALRSEAVAIDGILDMFKGLTTTPSISPDEEINLETFCDKGKWGYCSKDRIVIPAIFDSAVEFRDGTAYVDLCGHRHKINTKGEIINTL